MFKGSLVALITPFRDHELDEGAFQKHVAWQIEQGTHWLVPCGTTGESPALADYEQRRLVTLCVEVAKGKRVPVIAGTGTNSTEHTIALTRQANQVGADAALIVCPYYNKPTQEGLYQHFKTIHDSVDLPIIIYNIPGRSAVDMTSATMARRLGKDIPDLVVPGELIDRLEQDRYAGVDAACELVERIRDSGALDGVHLIPVTRFREVTARLERTL